MVIKKKRTGFARMSPEKQREAASNGGFAAHEKGVARLWSRDEAIAAGKRGREQSAKRREEKRRMEKP